MILDRLFLATIYPHILVFNREISLGIKEDRVLFDMDGGIYHSKIPVENFYMANSIQEDKSFNLLEIGDDLFSYKSLACLLFEQNTLFCNDESIDTLDSSDNMEEPEVEHKNVKKILNLGKIMARWHVSKPVWVFYDNEWGKDYGMWPTSNLDISNGYDVVYGK
nr:hypothetical protein [Tanacetum cinerariifolium]